MKKYLVIGNPIKHSLSPKLHNYWIKQHNLYAIYDKKLLNEENIEEIITEVKKDKITGINVTVPFKKSVIPFLDKLTPVAKATQSVNTVYKINNEIWGENTDEMGFDQVFPSLDDSLEDKKVFILGAGGVAPSIIYALYYSRNKIFLSNRKKQKAEELKKLFPEIEIIEWGKKPPMFDVAINATSVGLKKDDRINLDFSEYNKNKNKLFYDVIYSPEKTNFLFEAEKRGNKIENGKMMFLYQARFAFEIWHGVLPTINNKVINLLND